MGLILTEKNWSHVWSGRLGSLGLISEIGLRRIFYNTREGGREGGMEGGVEGGMEGGVEGEMEGGMEGGSTLSIVCMCRDILFDRWTRGYNLM